MMGSIFTFIIYFILFSLSMFFIKNAESNIGKKNISFVLFSVLALLPPILFAGFRGITVGTDVKTYAMPEFELCTRCGEISNYFDHTTTNIGYAFIVAISALFFNSFNVLLMLTAALQLIPIYIAAYRLRDRLYIHNVMLAFYLLDYVIGFNIMRQSIAVAFILLGFVEIVLRNRIQGIICVIVAALFHSTAIIGILFMIDGLLIYSVKKKKLRIALISITTLLLFVIIINWQNIVIGGIYLEIFPADRMQTYIDIFTGSSKAKQYMFDISFSQYLEIIFKIIYLLIPLLFLESRISIGDKIKTLKNDVLVISTLSVYLLAVIINVAFLILFHSAFGYRMAMYGEYFILILIPLICGKHRINRNRNSLIITKKELMCYGIFLVSFYILFMYFGQHMTLPLYFQIY